MAESPGEVLASMGNYVFTADVLIDAVTTRRRRRDVRPRPRRQHHPGARRARPGVRLGLREQPGAGASDRDLAYWRDVGTLDAYYDAHMDLISVDPMFNLYNEDWPILTWPEQLPPAKFVFEEDGRVGAAMNSMVCAGVVVSGGTVRRSILSPACTCTRTRWSRAPCSCTTSTSAAARPCATRSSTRTFASPRGRRSASTRRPTGPRFAMSRAGSP